MAEPQQQDQETVVAECQANQYQEKQQKNNEENNEENNEINQQNKTS